MYVPELSEWRQRPSIWLGGGSSFSFKHDASKTWPFVVHAKMSSPFPDSSQVDHTRLLCIGSGRFLRGLLLPLLQVHRPSIRAILLQPRGHDVADAITASSNSCRPLYFHVLVFALIISRATLPLSPNCLEGTRLTRSITKVESPP
jgi:hypothetical protein